MEAILNKCEKEISENIQRLEEIQRVYEELRHAIVKVKEVSDENFTLPSSKEDLIRALVEAVSESSNHDSSVLEDVEKTTRNDSGNQSQDSVDAENENNEGSNDAETIKKSSEKICDEGEDDKTENSEKELVAPQDKLLETLLVTAGGKKGVKYQIEVTSSLEKDCTFWACNKDNNFLKEKLEPLSSRLKKSSLQKDLCVTDSSYKGLVCGKSQNSGLWLRALIIKEISNEKVRVRLVDVGKTEEYFIRELKKVPEDLAAIPCMAFHCKLFEEECIITDYDVRWRFNDLTIKQILNFTIEKIIEEENSSLLIGRLETVIDKLNICEEIKNMVLFGNSKQGSTNPGMTSRDIRIQNNDSSSGFTSKTEYISCQSPTKSSASSVEFPENKPPSDSEKLPNGNLTPLKMPSNEKILESEETDDSDAMKWGDLDTPGYEEEEFPLLDENAFGDSPSNSHTEAQLSQILNKSKTIDDSTTPSKVNDIDVKKKSITHDLQQQNSDSSIINEYYLPKENIHYSQKFIQMKQYELHLESLLKKQQVILNNMITNQTSQTNPELFDKLKEISVTQQQLNVLKQAQNSSEHYSSEAYSHSQPLPNNFINQVPSADPNMQQTFNEMTHNMPQSLQQDNRHQQINQNYFQNMRQNFPMQDVRQHLSHGKVNPDFTEGIKPMQKNLPQYYQPQQRANIQHPDVLTTSINHSVNRAQPDIVHNLRNETQSENNNVKTMFHPSQTHSIQSPTQLQNFNYSNMQNPLSENFQNQMHYQQVQRLSQQQNSVDLQNLNDNVPIQLPPHLQNPDVLRHLQNPDVLQQLLIQMPEIQQQILSQNHQQQTSTATSQVNVVPVNYREPQNQIASGKTMPSENLNQQDRKEHVASPNESHIPPKDSSSKVIESLKKSQLDFEVPPFDFLENETNASWRQREMHNLSHPFFENPKVKFYSVLCVEINPGKFSPNLSIVYKSGIFNFQDRDGRIFSEIWNDDFEKALIIKHRYLQADLDWRVGGICVVSSKIFRSNNGSFQCKVKFVSTALLRSVSTSLRSDDNREVRQESARYFLGSVYRKLQSEDGCISLFAFQRNIQHQLSRSRNMKPVEFHHQQQPQQQLQQQQLVGRTFSLEASENWEDEILSPKKSTTKSFEYIEKESNESEKANSNSDVDNIEESIDGKSKDDVSILTNDYGSCDECESKDDFEVFGVDEDEDET